MDLRLRKVKNIHIAAAFIVVAALLAGGAYIQNQKKETPSGSGVTIIETVTT